MNTPNKEDSAENSQGVQRCWLVRHGLTPWNEQHRYCGHSDVPLSVAGRAQARWLAAQLRPRPLQAIYSSDLARAHETAEIIASKHVPPVVVTVSTAWREIAFGAWEGLTYSEIASAFADQLDFFTDPEHYAPPGGEALADVLRRVQPALTELMMQRTSYHEGDIVIVSHGGTMRGLLCALLGISLSYQWQLRMDPGSLSAVDLSLDGCGSPVATLALLNWQRSPTRYALSLPIAYRAQVGQIPAVLPGCPEARSEQDA
jgi:broad specificity phosphatase PhoE